MNRQQMRQTVRKLLRDQRTFAATSIAEMWVQLNEEKAAIGNRQERRARGLRNTRLAKLAKKAST